ncbi:MAG: alpha/beta hydrolase domain-containing protein [Acidobacteriaceae bacterium]
MRRYFTIISLLVAALSASPLSARVVRVEIARRADVLNGRAFGNSGSYERLTGRVYFSVPVGNPHNLRIVDLRNAVNLKDGEVEFSADFVGVRPKDAHKGNGSLLLEVPNRGQARILSLVDGGDQDLAADAGDAWLLRNGFTVVTLGWQWDATDDNPLRLFAPIAKENGKTISGLLRGDVMPWKEMAEIPLGHLFRAGAGGAPSLGGTEYPVAAPDDSRNVLTVRDSPEAARTVIPRATWQFAHLVNGKLTASDRHIHLDGGFHPGKIYEYVYVVSDPVVAGLGFAAIRDLASYAKHAKDSITPAARVYGEGISQNGRFLRDFLYQGFNADEDGRIALDGVLAHVAGAGRGSFNYRFAQPSRDAQPMAAIFFPTDIFPFTDQPEKDPLTGDTAGLLDRAAAEKVMPKIFFSNTSYEYWGRAAALTHTSADGKQDAVLSDHVRIYHLTGLEHSSGPFPPEKGKEDLVGQQPRSPLPVKYFWRAMIANMDAWVRSDTLPPASSYTRIADGTLVPLQKFSFPPIAGINMPHDANRAYRVDFGPGWRDGILSVQPPKVGEAFPVLVPQVDADGNERDGVRLPEVTVPLATYTGWNLRDPSIGAPYRRIAFEGSYIPFCKIAEDCRKAGDPRKSIAERYSNREEYSARYQAAVDDLVKQRWILPEDRESLLRRGVEEWAEATK